MITSILISANKKTSQSLFNFQTDIGAAVHATLETEQLISPTRNVFVDTIASLKVMTAELLQFQKCMNYLTRFITFWTMPWLNGLVIHFGL